MVFAVVITAHEVVYAKTFRCDSSRYTATVFPCGGVPNSLVVLIKDKITSSSTRILKGETTVLNYFKLTYVAAPVDKEIYSMVLDINNVSGIRPYQVVPATLEINQKLYQVNCTKGRDPIY